MIYMDNAATTPVLPEVLEEMLPYFSQEFGNASTIYDLGQRSRMAIDEARKRIAHVIGADAREIYFTSGGTEADNWVLEGAAQRFLKEHLRASVTGGNREAKNAVYRSDSTAPVTGSARTDGTDPETVKTELRLLQRSVPHIITDNIEHHAVLNTCRYLEEMGVRVTCLDVDRYGRVRPEDVAEAIGPDTALVSIMAANNEIGTIEPISEIGKICRERGVLFHTDAAQAFGQIPLDVKEMHIDYLSSSAHKLGGPKGIGFLYMRKGQSFPPHEHGGAQERGRRAGTENTPAIVGFGKAACLAEETMEARADKERLIRDHLIRRLTHEIPGCVLNGDPEERLPGNVNVLIPGIEGEEMVQQLNRYGIAAGSGAACSSGSLEPSHVLKAIGRSHADSFCGLRLSLGAENTMEEADCVADCVRRIAEVCRH